MVVLFSILVQDTHVVRFTPEQPQPLVLEDSWLAVDASKLSDEGGPIYHLIKEGWWWVI